MQAQETEKATAGAAQTQQTRIRTVVEVGVGVKAARFAAKGVRMRQNKNHDVTCTQAASRAC